MEKILKPYTIIPPHLYVNRNADRQLRNIVSDMGRPGYVLVSRQMGKTNLLLNAKRELGNGNDKFIYVDLSNVFEDEQSCFQNIIDLALETNEDIYSEATKIILKGRKEITGIPPHKQHSNELRTLLKYTSGKLIIILDEIDALTKTNYSDKIFAQIRSIYFSRVNFPELERLTYILSGVVEPTEIIKDPKISPFNIGEKIFLNDFSNEEYLHFLEIARLSDLSNEIKERIFHWTNGNPRMTWDLCSEIEDNKNIIKSKEHVDNLVQKLYLTSFDKPPIDNIRELVKKDREIRNSIIELEHNNGKDVSDKTKSKLYLAGIINYEENDIHIKNEIIKSSLNLDWIKKLDEEDKGLVELALENYRNRNYPNALEYFEKYLETAEFPESNRDMCYHYMGYCTFRDKKYEKSIDYLNKSNLNLEVFPTLHYYNWVIKGIVLRILKEYPQSEECYEYVIKNSTKDSNYLLAALDYGFIIMNNYVKKDIKYAIELFENIVLDKFQFSSRISKETLDYYKSSSYYNLAYIFKTQNNIIESKKYIKLGLSIDKNIHNKSSLLLLLAEITEELNEKTKILLDLIELLLNITEPELLPEQKLSIVTIQLKDVLIELYTCNKEVFKKIIDDKKSFITDKPLAEFLFEMAIFSINRSNVTVAILIMEDLYEDKKKGLIKLDQMSYFTILRLLSYLAEKKSLDMHIEYIENIKTIPPKNVDLIDLHIFSFTIFSLLEEKKYNEGLKYAEIINSLKPLVNENDIKNYFIIYNLELNIYALQNNIVKGIEKSREILNLLNTLQIKTFDNNLLTDESLKVIKENALTFIEHNIKLLPPIILNKKYNRNDLITVEYYNGEIIKTKFKKIEKDVYQHKCKIIN